MKNARLIENVLDEVKADPSPILRERVQVLTDIIEALQNIAGSSYWKVLKQHVFEVDLERAKRSLAHEKDTTEMFRYQGEIRWGEKYSLEVLVDKYRSELITLKQKLNE